MALNTLKQKARSFAAEHGVPYLTALRAVDEPLHGLRAVFDCEYPEAGFHLIARPGSYGAAYGSRREEHMVARSFSPFSMRSYTVESGRRLSILDGAGVKDIWSYRELHRAGLLPQDYPSLEPAFHYYSGALDSTMQSMFQLSVELGIYPVNLSRQLQIADERPLRPVTESQLEALKRGEPAGAIEKRFTGDFGSRHPSRIPGNFTTMVRFLEAGKSNPLRFALLIEGSRDDMIRELEARDIAARLPEIEDLSGRDVYVQDNGGTTIFIDGKAELWAQAGSILTLTREQLSTLSS